MVYDHDYDAMHMRLRQRVAIAIAMFVAPRSSRHASRSKPHRRIALEQPA